MHTCRDIGYCKCQDMLDPGDNVLDFWALTFREIGELGLLYSESKSTGFYFAVAKHALCRSLSQALFCLQGD